MPVILLCFPSERSRGTGPRATEKTPPLTVGRGPVPRHRPRARLCSSGSSEALASLPSDPDPFVIRRSQTTDRETHIVTMELAGDSPPRYGDREIAGETRSDARVASEGPRATGTSSPEVSPTGMYQDPARLPTLPFLLIFVIDGRFESMSLA